MDKEYPSNPGIVKSVIRQPAHPAGDAIQTVEVNSRESGNPPLGLLQGLNLRGLHFPLFAFFA
jgi:hypothetical protein